MKDGGHLTEAAALVGWSPLDLDMFSSWFFTDREVFSYERIERLLAL
jgi:hypothetical protein